MLVKHVTENEDGTLEFTGELKEDELAFVVETGMNILLAQGAMSFQNTEEKAH